MSLETCLSEQISEVEKASGSATDAGLLKKQQAAVRSFKQTGFPNASMEDWKYTDPSAILSRPYPLFTSTKSAITEETADFETYFTPALNTGRLVIADGQLISTEGLPSEIICSTLKQIQNSNSELRQIVERHFASHASVAEPFVALNTALLSDAVVISIPQGITVSKPVEILNLSTSASADKTLLPRILIVAGRNSESSLIERFESSLPVKESFTNSVVEFVLEESARLSHFRIQNESLNSLMVSNISASLDENASLTTFTFSFGGKLVRNNVNVVLQGRNCHVTMNGLTAINGEQHVDNQTLLDNAQPNCESVELYKGIYGDSSQGVFSGTIIVRPDAQKTNAIQSNRSLLLSDKAGINTKPQLKIWADDVKCTHGATIGQLDEDGMFYLRSRGVSEKDARIMLVHAFASEIISAVGIEALRINLEEMLFNKLHI